MHEKDVYPEPDDEPTWPGGGTYEEVPGTNLSPLAAAVGVVGIYLGRALLALGAVCFVVVALFLAAGGAP